MNMSRIHGPQPNSVLSLWIQDSIPLNFSDLWAGFTGFRRGSTFSIRRMNLLRPILRTAVCKIAHLTPMESFAVYLISGYGHRVASSKIRKRQIAPRIRLSDL